MSSGCVLARLAMCSMLGVLNYFLSNQVDSLALK